MYVMSTCMKPHRWSRGTSKETSWHTLNTHLHPSDLTLKIIIVFAKQLLNW